jgi:hypothetical protein
MLSLKCRKFARMEGKKEVLPKTGRINKSGR